MPLPFALDHVNCWLIGASVDDLMIIDTGIHSDATCDLWQQLLDASGVQLKHLLITHYHPDHIGLASWFQSNHTSLPVIMSQLEYEQAKAAFEATDEHFATAQADWYRQQGMPQEQLSKMAAKGNSYRQIVAGLPLVDRIVKAGDTVNAGGYDWQVITGGGHAPEQITLYAEAINVLIAADQILPRITPNISLNWYKNRQDPLADFLDSFTAYDILPADVLVLPSHGLPFTGLHDRLNQLRAHHHERLEQLRNATEQPLTGYELLPVLFDRELDPRQMMFAMGECLAHLRYLENQHEMTAATSDGITRFQRA